MQKKKEEEENKELQVIRSGLRSRELGKKKNWPPSPGDHDLVEKVSSVQEGKGEDKERRGQEEETNRKVRERKRKKIE